MRSGIAFEAKQGIPYFLGVSGTTAGAKHLSLNLVVVPPRARAEPHTHSDFESAIYCGVAEGRTPSSRPQARSAEDYVLSGRAGHHWGERLEHAMETRAGDFLFIAPGVAHDSENPYDEPVVAVVARNDPEEQEHVIPFAAP